MKRLGYSKRNWHLFSFYQMSKIDILDIQIIAHTHTLADENNILFAGAHGNRLNVICHVE